jgi:hypothetical protein
MAGTLLSGTNCDFVIDRFNRWISLDIPLRTHRWGFNVGERDDAASDPRIGNTMLKAYYTAPNRPVPQLCGPFMGSFHFAVGILNAFTVKDAR